MERLPYIDEHAITVVADTATTWAALPAVPLGFSLEEARRPHRLALKGRHWFSAYRLVFVLTDVTHDPTRPRTRVVAETWARFPGVTGAAYRSVVIGTRAHRMVVRQMLKRIAREAHSRSLTTA
ncbi:MAG: hypothetical protein K0R68_610 [Mycobacterium sp.]|nr:hypothetical protein [Mycobacterium sp.]